MRQLRWAFTGVSLSESKTRPRAKAKWHRDLGCVIPERDWIESWVSVHKAPTSDKVRSFLWKLMHRCLNLLCYEHNAIYYGRGDIAPSQAKPRFTCSSNVRRPRIYGRRLMPKLERWAALSPRTRILGAPPSVSLCQALIGRIDIPADNPPPLSHTGIFGSGNRGRRCGEPQWRPFGTCAAQLSSVQLRWQNLSA